MRRAVLFAALLVLAGCGSRSTTIPASTVADVVREAGFADVHHLTGPKAPSPSAFASAEHLAGFDFIYVGPFRAALTSPLTALWAESRALAARRLAADRPLLRGSYPRDLSPPGFESARLHETQVCNVVVSSYNAGGDPELARRYQRVVDLLREHCR